MIIDMRNSVLRIIKSDKKNWFFFSLHIISAFLVSMAGLYAVEMARKVVDEGMEIQEKLFSYLLVACVVILGGSLFSFFETYSASVFSINSIRMLRDAAVKKLNKIKYSFFDNAHSGTILNRINGDIDLIQTNLEGNLPQFITAFFRFATAFLYLSFINFRLVMVCIVLTIVVFMFVKIVINPISKIFDKHQKKLDEAMEVANDCISGVYIQKSYNLEEEMKRKFDEKIDEVTRQSLKRQKILAITWPLTDILKFLPTIVCMVLGFVSAYQGEITGGDFVAFVILLGKITEPMSEFPVLMAAYKEALVCVKRINQIYQKEEETSGFYNPQKESSEYEENVVVKFSEVDFGYSQGETILNNLSFQIPKHQMVAFVGASGSGKSSLFKVISKLYDSQRGEIYFLGKALKDWQNEALREQIAYVPQEVYLFPCSIEENIAYGRPEATREEIVKMAKLAQAHEFILQLPDGYDTNVGERGIKLSGGQRQRIAIARAFLKDAPVLLLDEITSALDGGSERLLQQALKSYAEKRTVLVIAHRLSTILDADNIYVLEKGTIVEQGQHNKLIEKNGAYKRLYTKQLGEGMKDEVNMEGVC